jgi:PAS domain S-box-containing protein
VTSRRFERVAERLSTSPLTAPVGVFIVILAVGGMAVASIVAGNSSDNNRERLTEEIQPLDRALRDLEIDVYRGSADARAYTFTGNSVFRLRFLRAEKDIQDAPAVIGLFADGTGFEGQSDDVVDDAVLWLDTATRSVDASALGNTAESERILVEESAPALDTFGESSAALESGLRAESESIQANIDRVDRIERLVFYLAGPIGILVGAVLIWLAFVNNRLLRSTEEGLARLDSMVDAIENYGVLELDTAGKITFCSNAASAILGYSDNDLHGKSLHALVHPDRDEALCPLMQALSGRRPVLVEESFQSSDGDDVPVELNAAPILVAGDFTGSVVVFQDVSGRLLQQRSREGFIAYASHELRSPLTSITGFAQWLNKRISQSPDEFEEPVRDAVETMDREARRMRTITEVVLDLASMQSGGRLRINPEAFELRQLVEEEVQLARERHQELNIEVAVPETRLPITSDPVRVRQVLVNLIDNAARYGGNMPSVHVLVERADGEMCVCVRDNGPGIPEEDQPYIFQEYYRGRPGSRSGSGLGIGLFISRRIAEQLGGTLSFRNMDGRGAEFVLTLPVVSEPSE